MASRGNKISILVFEVAITITKGSILFQPLLEENIQFLKKEILQSGVQQLGEQEEKEEKELRLVLNKGSGSHDGYDAAVVEAGNACSEAAVRGKDETMNKMTYFDLCFSFSV
ncbi:hypothetical protein PIB30_019114 [Stylosanthes scabra]|uniref:DUF3475 domain-containing protein n=1 Tax=Stylosanthes scabra TaxID=79078 RepID=A0ABU6VAG7_9FABA|nr:hypothetical protein [Stylosanthes scabra]